METGTISPSFGLVIVIFNGEVAVAIGVTVAIAIGVVIGVAVGVEFELLLLLSGGINIPVDAVNPRTSKTAPIIPRTFCLSGGILVSTLPVILPAIAKKMNTIPAITSIVGISDIFETNLYHHFILLI